MDRDKQLADRDQRGRIGSGSSGLPQSHDRKEAHDADDDGGFKDTSTSTDRAEGTVPLAGVLMEPPTRR